MFTQIYKYHINGKYKEEDPYLIDTGERTLKRVLSVRKDVEGIPSIYVEVSNVPELHKRLMRVYTFFTGEEFHSGEYLVPKVYLGTVEKDGLIVHYYYDIIEV